MDFNSESEYPSYDEMVDVARHMFALALDGVTPAFAQITVEQFRSAVRDHMLSIDCDPNDENQLRAAAMGALLAVHTQMSYTQIGNVTAMLPAAIVNMIVEPVGDTTLQDWDRISQIFSTGTPYEEPSQPKWRSVRRFIQGLLDVSH